MSANCCFVAHINTCYVPPLHRGHVLRWLPRGRGSAILPHAKPCIKRRGLIVPCLGVVGSLFFLLFHNHYHPVHTVRSKIYQLHRTKFPVRSPHPRYPRPTESLPRAISEMPELSRNTHQSPRGRTPARQRKQHGLSHRCIGECIRIANLRIPM